MNEYLKAFVIGSCLLVFAPYFIGVLNAPTRNFSYELYTFVGPIVLGLFNMLSVLLARIFHLTINQRFLVISILAPTIITSMSLLFGFYTKPNIKEWIMYASGLYLIYFIIFNVVIKYLTVSI